jgi:hypothetical protein
MKSEVQFVVDSKGNQTGVLMPPEVYEAIMQRLEDQDIARAARERKDEPGRPLSEFIAELQVEGEIDV